MTHDTLSALARISEARQKQAAHRLADARIRLEDERGALCRSHARSQASEQNVGSSVSAAWFQTLGLARVVERDIQSDLSSAVARRQRDIDAFSQVHNSAARMRARAERALGQRLADRMKSILSAERDLDELRAGWSHSQKVPA